jgi:hypothetical protein
MKILKILAILALPLVILQSCDKSELEVKATEGALIEIKSPSLNYVVGNPGPYTGSVRIYQGTVKATQIDIYATFYTSRVDTVVETDSEGAITKSEITTELVSNTVLFKTITPSSTDQNTISSFSFTFDELASPLTIETENIPAVNTDNSYVINKGAVVNDLGKSLSMNDGDYFIGDKWELAYKVTTSDGREIYQNKPTNVTVATRYAGKYIIASSAYYRIGEPSIGLWDGEEALIESIDAKTYRWTDWGAPYGWESNGNVGLYFQIEGGVVTYPAEWGGAAQTINGQPLITCALNPTDLTNVSCGSSNIVINDDVNGEDQLLLVHGYFTAGSGAREFDFVLVKVVE